MPSHKPAPSSAQVKAGGRYVNGRLAPALTLPIAHTAELRAGKPTVVCVARRRADEPGALSSDSAGAPEAVQRAAAVLGLVEGLTLWHFC